LDSRLASQMRRNTEWRSGAAILSPENIDRFGMSVIAVPWDAGGGPFIA
jgi:hypothetical protein